jgi:predicted dehydrogenase
VITVDTPTHLSATLDFASGAVATLVTSFDVWAHHIPCIEVHGSLGSISVPDPNGFGGKVEAWTTQSRKWEEIPLVPIRAENSRCIGVADMAYAIRTGRKHRANGQMAGHVLDVFHAVLDSSRESKYVDLASTCERPKAMPIGLPSSKLDE